MSYHRIATDISLYSKYENVFKELEVEFNAKFRGFDLRQMPVGVLAQQSVVVSSIASTLQLPQDDIPSELIIIVDQKLKKVKYCSNTVPQKITELISIILQLFEDNN
ncbi:MAG: hypothetical protein AAF846_28480 [Chloroflexota bacterium]